MSDQFDVDLFVIGGGSGGVRAARIAAAHGARVAIAEKDRWGGTCVIRGCIPKKLFVYASDYAHQFEDARAYGWNIEKPTFDWSRLIANKDKEIARLSGLYLANLERHGVQILDGHAKFLDPHTIECDDHRLKAKNILIASGGRPFVPPVKGAEHAISSDQAFHLDRLPKRVAVVGGGYIGVEFAHIFAGLGSQVTLVHRRDLVLRGFDDDLRRAVTENLGKSSVTPRLSSTIEHIEKSPGGELTATFNDGSKQCFDQIMCAMGRVANTDELGLEKAGVKVDERAAVVVDEYSQTNVDHIFAVGDCTGRIDLTPVAIRDGHAVADALFSDSRRAIDHQTIPTAVFCQPAAATVGMTEKKRPTLASAARFFAPASGRSRQRSPALASVS